MENNINIRQITIDGLKEFLFKAITINNTNSLELIFDMHFKLDDKSELISNLIMNLNEVFQYTGMGLLAYIQFNETFNVDDLKLQPKVYRNTIDSINKIKIKYGFLVRKLLMASQSPFLLNSVETNIAPNNSLHKIKFLRADGEFLDAMFNPEGLMMILTGLTNAVQTSMEQGIYNLSDNTLTSYNNQIKKFTEYLGNLDQISDQVAITKEKKE
jgi:hypothetical protein